MKNNRLLLSKIILTLVFTFYTLISFSQTSQTFGTAASSGTFTFTVPAGVTGITAELWGAGGGGSNRAGAAGAGGGGAYTRSTLQSVTGGNTYNVTVGAGGTIGTPTAAPGNFSRMVIGANTFTANGGLSINSTTNRAGGVGGAIQTASGIIAARFAGGNGGSARTGTAAALSGEGNEAGGGGGGSSSVSANGDPGDNGNGVVNVAT
ncbi:MAG: hypothetical protein K9I26_04770, partial [Flavobacterium sp.]|nr:hypothetical protein [Flavobacterium sp.]